MSLSSTTTTNLRRAAAATSLALVVSLGLGAGVAAAQDQHSGGTSPNTESRDPGTPTEVQGVTVSRDGGLPVTGSDVAGLVGLGAAAVAVGAGAVVVSKRRPRVSA